MAGGTSLALLIKQNLVAPAVVIGLRRVPGLTAIEIDGDGWLRIGALVPLRAVERDATVRQRWPGLADAVGRVATVRIRNQATLGGNLAHADPAQDPPPMLLALDARAEISGPSGSRELPLDELFVDVFETALAEDEVLVAVRVPPSPTAARTTYLKFLPRTVDDYATVAVAARAATNTDGRLTDVRVALGAVGPVPVRIRAIEAALEGRPANQARDGLLTEAAGLVADAIDPVDDGRGSAAYKRDLARVLTARALAAVIEEAR
jgi:carbon-monoxide dehydrogenase medium subunit